MQEVAVWGRRRRRGRGASGFATITDTFTRANSTTTMGSTESPVLPWTVMNGSTWGILTNAGYNVTATTDSGAWVESGVADCSVTITVGTVSGTPQLGVLVRRTTDANFITAFWSGGNLFFRKVVAGSPTNLTTASARTLNGGDTLKVTGSGSTLHVYHNGVDVFGAVTETFNQTATKHGLYSFGTDTFTTADTFTVTVP